MSDLEGPALDAAVAAALGTPWRKPTHGPCCTCQTCGHPNDGECQCGYSTDWEKGGPVLARMRVEIGPVHHRPNIGTRWWAFLAPGVRQYGDTPLIAAMRAYVATINPALDVPRIKPAK